jgi:hypothetical protein
MSKSKKNIPNSPAAEETTTWTPPTEAAPKAESPYIYMVYAFLLFVIGVCLYQMVIYTKIHLAGDNADYYVLAKALMDGKGYTNVSNVDLPAANHFPPGYPFILSILMRILGTDQATLTAFNSVFLLASLYLLLDLFKKSANNIHLAFAVVAACLFNAYIMEYATIMMSEVPFLFFSVLTLWFFVKIDLDKNPFTQKFFYPFVLLLSAAFYIRTAGLSLVAGIFFYLLLQKNWKYLVSVAGIFILLALPWQMRSRSLTDKNGKPMGNSYVKQLTMVNPYRPEMGALGTQYFDAQHVQLDRDSIVKLAPQVKDTANTTGQIVADLTKRITNNTKRYISREVPAGIFPWLEHDPKDPTSSGEWLMGLLVCGLMGFGIYRLQEYRTLFIGYTLGSFGILLLWPDVWFGVRFALPLLPFLLFFFANGLYSAIKFGLDKANLGDNIFAKAVLPLLLMVVFIPKWFNMGTRINQENQQEEPTPSISTLKMKAESEYEPSYKNYFAAAEWIKANTPKDAVICCRKPSLLYLSADRYVTQFKNTTDVSDFVKDLAENRKATYVVLDQLGYADVGRYLLPAIQQNPRQFQIVQQFKEPDTYVLKFDAKQPSGTE